MTALALTIIAIFPWNGPGTSALPLLRFGQGPRGGALGEAFTALADDATAIYWNSAGLGKVANYSLCLSHQSWFDGASDELFQAALPFNTGTFGLGILYSATPGIEFWNENNEPGDTFSTWQTVLNLGYGTSLFEKYYLGAGIKGCYDNLFTTGGYGGGLDLGFAARPLNFLNFGVALRNFGVVKYRILEHLPAELAFGIALTGSNFTALVDGVKPFDNQFNLRLGVEYQPVSQLNLRLGYRTGPQDISELGLFSGLTAGIGINLVNFALDYSLSSYGKLGWCHRVGIRLAPPRHGNGVLRIRVIDADTRKPVWALIKLEGIRQYSGETNRLGELLVSGLTPGRIIIHTSNKNYLARTDTMLILGDREQSAVIDLSPIRYSTLTGTIYDASTNRPVPATIIYQGPVYGELENDPNFGTYIISTVPTGRYVITVQATAPYLPQRCTLNLAPGRLTQQDFYLSKRQ
ncbi:MAG: PorV/PorQ family protein [candidate division WOR-3 bacterium]|jgi:hypothetical protein